MPDASAANVSTEHKAVALTETADFEHWFSTRPETPAAAVSLADGRTGNSGWRAGENRCPLLTDLGTMEAGHANRESEY